MYFIFFIGSTMNYEADAGIDLEFQPFMAVGQKKINFNVFYGKTVEKNSIFVQF